jgi:hypothetical protein
MWEAHSFQLSSPLLRSPLAAGGEVMQHQSLRQTTAGKARVEALALRETLQRYRLLLGLLASAASALGTYQLLRLLLLK